MFIDGTNCQHLTKEELDSYMELNIILGCGKPLQSFVNRSGILFVDKYFDPLWNILSLVQTQIVA